MLYKISYFQSAIPLLNDVEVQVLPIIFRSQSDESVIFLHLSWQLLQDFPCEFHSIVVMLAKLNELH